MRIIITPNARRLLSLFAKEIRLQQDRVRGGHIKDVDAERFLIERLVAIGKKDPSVQAFLTYVGPIPKEDDEDKDRPWAEDPRDGREHVVNSVRDKSEGVLGVPRKWEDDRPWPSPNERIA